MAGKDTKESTEACEDVDIDTTHVLVKWTKVTVSGPSGTGKSSTLRLLLDEPPILSHLSTPVVRKVETKLISDRRGSEWEKVPNLEEVLVSQDDLHFIYAVDTGGQAAFLDIAPALLRYNSVNIITHKLDEKLEDETSFFYSVEGKRIGDPIKRQLTNLQVLESSIRSLASVKKPDKLNGIKVLQEGTLEVRAEGELDGKPSIIVLGTFHDLISQSAETLKEKNTKLAESLAGFDKDTTILKYSDGSLIFPLNAVARGDDEKKIAEAIRHEVRKAYIEARIPKKWFIFQIKLNELNTNGVATKKDCDDIGMKLDMSSSDVTAALIFFHNLTIILYFDKILPGIVFLDPQPLFDKLSELISVSFARGADYFQIDRDIELPPTAHDDMKSRGTFTEELLMTEGFMGMEYTASNFLKLLQNLQIIIEIPTTPKLQYPNYFLPCVLPTAKDLSKLKEKYEKNLDPLVLRWEGRIIPQGLYCALVLGLLQEEIVDISGFLDKKKIREQFRNAIEMPCSVEFGDDHNILLVDSVTHLEVHYSGNPKNCYKIRGAVFQQLNKAARAFHYNSRLSNPEACFWDSQQKQFLKVDYEKEYPPSQQPWLKGRQTKRAVIRNGFDTPSVKDALLYLEELDFNMQLWSYLGEELMFTEDALDKIERQSKYVSRNLHDCLSRWLDGKEGVGTRTWNTLIAALNSL